MKKSPWVATGAKVQVMKKGGIFSPRANKLFSFYSHDNSLAELPEKNQKQIQNTFALISLYR